ncbi:MAG: acyl-CoA synthetase [Deltaproteobacteria bacterium]|nr:MAG: acyl-CoA synthetase [Deltaproteobacteria bacterium]
MSNLPTFAFWARTDRDRVAVIDPEYGEHTVGELQDRANQIARNLQAMGLEHGDALAYCTRNCVEILELALATQQIGVYLVPASWHLTKPELGYILEDSRAKVVVTTPKLADKARGTAAKVLIIGGEGDEAYESLKTGSTEPPEERWAGATMTYTSGTTGKPKGVRRPLAKAPPEPVASGYAMFMMVYTMKPNEGVHLVVSPLYHTAVLYFASSTLHLGHQVVIMDKWTPEGMLERIEKYRVTNSHMVPTQFTRLLNCPDRGKYDVSSLQNMVHGAAPCPKPVKKAMLEWWGDCVYEYYAASEGGGTIIGPKDWRERPGSVGKPWPTADIKIFDDEGYELAPNEVGTVYIKMAQSFEYHRDKAKTEKAWRTDGYFTVGDAGYLDEDGFLYLCDRKADMIISGGVNIYPAEIESVLSEHPKVLDVAVFGIPDDDWGEQVKAVIEVKGSQDIGLEASILAWARERIAGFKCPKSIDFVDTMPREENGKLRKRLLRDPYWEGTGRQI